VVATIADFLIIIQETLAMKFAEMEDTMVLLGGII
jgi:hypothetical protein